MRNRQVIKVRDHKKWDREQLGQWEWHVGQITLDTLSLGRKGLVIAMDDTLLPGYDGGPCAGIDPVVRIRSLAKHLIDELDRLNKSVGPEHAFTAEESAEILREARDYLLREAKKLDRRIKSTAS